jgi:hypothetical protein
MKRSRPGPQNNLNNNMPKAIIRKYSPNTGKKSRKHTQIGTKNSMYPKDMNCIYLYIIEHTVTAPKSTHLADNKREITTSNKEEQHKRKQGRPEVNEKEKYRKHKEPPDKKKWIS